MGVYVCVSDRGCVTQICKLVVHGFARGLGVWQRVRTDEHWSFDFRLYGFLDANFSRLLFGVSLSHLRQFHFGSFLAKHART